jgi:hypothetical protein
LGKRKTIAMPFPTFPDELDNKSLAALEKSKKVETELGDGLVRLKQEFGKIESTAFAVPPKLANDQDLGGFEKALDGEKIKIKALAKSLTDFAKQALAKSVQLKKEKANPAVVKHVESMVSAVSAFNKAMAQLQEETDDLKKKAQLLLEEATADAEEAEGEEGPKKADQLLLQGLKIIKSKPGLFALAIGGSGAYVVAGARVPPELLKQAKTESGGGKFLRGSCEWSQEKNAYIFGLDKKPPGGLAKKIRKAILDQTLNKLKDKVLVRGPDGQFIDADNDADTMGAVDLEDPAEIDAPPPPPPPSEEGTLFTQRMRSLSPEYVKAIQANPVSRNELDNLSGQDDGTGPARRLRSGDQANPGRRQPPRCERRRP